MLFNSSYHDPGLAIPAAAPSHQFHAQDEFGQFSFGHAGGPSARTEVSLTKSMHLHQDPKWNISLKADYYRPATPTE